MQMLVFFRYWVLEKARTIMLTNPGFDSSNSSPALCLGTRNEVNNKL